MRIALDGKAPWGEFGPQWHDGDGTPPLVLYREMAGSYRVAALLRETVAQFLRLERCITGDFTQNLFLGPDPRFKRSPWPLSNPQNYTPAKVSCRALTTKHLVGVRTSLGSSDML